jgi:hypothetical protein
MPEFLTILSVDDVTNRALVAFEDTDGRTNRTRLDMKIELPIDDFQNQEDLLDYLAGFWPYEYFDKPKTKPPNERNIMAKAEEKARHNIAGRVSQGRP